MNPVTWEFLNEPLYRWAIFLLAVLLILIFWHGVLSEMDVE